MTMNDLTLIAPIDWRRPVHPAKIADRFERYRARQRRAHDADPSLKLLSRVHDGLLIQSELRSGASDTARYLAVIGAMKAMKGATR
jgi:hypothetical protein